MEGRGREGGGRDMGRERGRGRGGVVVCYMYALIPSLAEPLKSRLQEEQRKRGGMGGGRGMGGRERRERDGREGEDGREGVDGRDGEEGEGWEEGKGCSVHWYPCPLMWLASD